MSFCPVNSHRHYVDAINITSDWEKLVNYPDWHHDALTGRYYPTGSDASIHLTHGGNINNERINKNY
eukprot:scaffold2197_cov169-Ochromonas_danica.AAC.1